MRHSPEEFGLKPDKKGWVKAMDLIISINEKRGNEEFTFEDLKKIVETAERSRHELNGSNIRAKYGHTLKPKIEKNPSKPPNLLFHGTLVNNIEPIYRRGLLSKKRQYIHLFDKKEKATEIASRRKGQDANLVGRTPHTHDKRVPGGVRPASKSETGN